ncbi:glucosamine inositolphosphorylceramide transferase family protein [Oharaeibacter diazotrophicus]|uniref:Glucosamine inositolphosphorylceramide transferase 1 N-terminal domain-containing protein n=2 Tax=Oharaeibacter diazotrophicus TaxID=1920512 RepID=A0A4R6RK51_9HYPH|nr:hypothetical protein [Oharaeibacter diazotrophicus]TDP86959.1 hypothetical protein EDD54_0844 [Oharaeibacter diazotrophicus]BBE71098.1 hypothetical protein OHA_1_00668 [Pleomorphomonas sp. SM30]GLS77850.1 hypothetical protein GCM10007904_31870 [Oharaeibacter diazotrophicus]
MRIALRIEADRVRRWHLRLADRLGVPGVDVAVVAAPPVPPPVGLDGLFVMERRLLRGGRPGGGDVADASAVAARLVPGGTFDMVVDLSARPALAPGASTLVVRYDGGFGDDAALAALLAGAVPVVEIAEAASGVVLERLHASTEMAVGVSGALDAVGARITTALVALTAAWRSGRARPEPPAIPAAPRGAPRPPGRILARELASTATRAVYRLLCEAPHWRVGWRHVDGNGVLARGDLSGPGWSVLPDPGGHFYADPFPAFEGGQGAIFFEDLDHRTGKGVVSVVRMGERGPVSVAETVLEQPTHLSYPFLLHWDGALHMVPESSAAGDVALWRCTRFPDRWERVATLISGAALADATLFEHAGRWWMTSVAFDGEGGYSDTLVIHHAPSPLGPWRPIEAEPVLIDRATARPAGAVVRVGDRLFRPVQDCSLGYGKALAITEITRLDEGGFAQTVVSRIAPGGRWPGHKLHTLNRLGRLEVIDGSVPRPRGAPFRALAERRWRPPA